MTDITPKAVLSRYIKAMETGADACLELMDKDIIFHAPCVPVPVPKIMTGLETVTGVYHLMFARVFKQFRWNGEIFATDNPEVAMALMTSQVVLMDGRSYSNEYTIISRVRDGKIYEHYEFFDTGRASEAFAGLVSN